METKAEPKKWERNNATWHLKRRRQMNFVERVASHDVLPLELYKKSDDQYQRSGKIPVHPVWRAPAWIIVHSFPALFIQMAWYHYYPAAKWNPLVGWLFYFFYFVGYLLLLVRNLHYWIKHYGVFDYENAGRDLPRDNEVPGLATGIIFTCLARIGGVILLGHYDSSVPPTFGLQGAAITPYTLVRMVCWFICLDMWFYIYHRAAHTVPFLWKIHAKHHATRHPTPLQAILAGSVQEVLEVVMIPLISTMFVKMNTYELWLTLCTLIYVEALGHSGARVYWGHPLLHPLLDVFGMAMVIEDHDLHHRYGKSGKSYGKQTLLWDTLFGTAGTRVDCIPGNIVGKA